MPDIVRNKTLTVEDWLLKARAFGLDAVEMYWLFLEDRKQSELGGVIATLKDLGLKVSMLTCSPDLTNPDPITRRQQMSQMEQNIEMAHRLGAPFVRVTTGQTHPGLTEEYGMALVEDSLMSLSEFAYPLGVKLAIENHYRDRCVWEREDFAASADVFLKLFERIKTLPIGVNFDCSNQLVRGEDPLLVLKEIKKRVVGVHASDRLVGEYQHSVIGEGSVPFDDIFAILAAEGFFGYISAEDGNPEGDEGFKRSLAFLRRKIDEYWPG